MKVDLSNDEMQFLVEIMHKCQINLLDPNAVKYTTLAASIISKMNIDPELEKEEN